MVGIIAAMLPGIKLKLYYAKFLGRFLKHRKTQSSRIRTHESCEYAALCGCTCMFTTYISKSIRFSKVRWRLQWWEVTTWSLSREGTEWEETMILANLQGRELMRKVKDLRVRKSSRSKRPIAT